LPTPLHRVVPCAAGAAGGQLHLRTPQLRERADDIPELVQHFFVKAKEQQGRPELVLPPRLLPYFSGYTWSGNVRELENIIERIVVLARGDEITLNDLPDFLRRERPAVEALHLDLPPQGISLEAVEKELIVRALERFNGNQTHAAQHLDISRKTLISSYIEWKNLGSGRSPMVQAKRMADGSSSTCVGRCDFSKRQDLTAMLAHELDCFTSFA
jgi:DNA-binding NtrC family response regulator